MIRGCARVAGAGVSAWWVSLGLSTAALAQDGPYRGRAIVTVEIASQRDLMAVMQLGEFLACQPGPGANDVLLREGGLEALGALGLKHEIRADDAQRVVDEATRLNDEARAQRGASFFDAFRTWQEINTLIDQLDTLPGVPASQVSVFVVGQTIEGRTVRGLTITAPPVPGAPPKPVFLITACQHAREWVAPMTAMWIADTLARQYGSNPTVTQLLDNVEFRIVPVVNADGYVYTFPVAQGGADNRYWRKNRRNNGASFGVDLNRNWSVGWGGSGSSGSASSETYRGPAAFSEPETANLRSLIVGPPGLPTLKAHIDLHTYGQYILGPWGYTTTPPPRSAELNALTAAQDAAVEALNGSDYIAGPGSTALYLAAGVAPDWSFGERGALAWTYELRPISSGLAGFSPPPTEIIPAAQEAFEGIKVLGAHIQIRLRVSLTLTPVALSTSVATPVSATITAENQYTLTQARLRYRPVGSGGSFSSIVMTGGPSSYGAALPATPCGGALQYYVEAQANDGAIITAPAGAPNFVLIATAPPCPGCPGDADNNGQVNFADITAALSAFGFTGVPGFTGDANDDGVVNFADVTSVLTAFGSSCS